LAKEKKDVLVLARKKSEEGESEEI
jgi:hypothetical protein